MTSPLEEGTPVRKASAGVVLIHGRGASAASMLNFAAALRLPDVHYRAPQAPGWTWYPHSFLAPLSANAPGIENGMRTIASLLADLNDQGMDADRIILLGFSQGACLASEYAARHPRRYGAVIALSGGLIGNIQRDDGEPPNDKGFQYEGSLEETPVFIGCSDVDPHIPVDRVRVTARVLGELGADVDVRIYEGMGHTVNDDEMNAIRDLVEQVQAG